MKKDEKKQLSFILAGVSILGFLLYTGALILVLGIIGSSMQDNASNQGELDDANTLTGILVICGICFGLIVLASVNVFGYWYWNKRKAKHSLR